MRKNLFGLPGGNAGEKRVIARPLYARYISDVSREPEWGRPLAFMEKSSLLLSFKKEDSSFLKKRSKRLLIIMDRLCSYRGAISQAVKNALDHPAPECVGQDDIDRTPLLEQRMRPEQKVSRRRLAAPRLLGKFPDFQ
jgi:hypothetical protein